MWSGWKGRCAWCEGGVCRNSMPWTRMRKRITDCEHWCGCSELWRVASWLYSHVSISVWHRVLCGIMSSSVLLLWLLTWSLELLTLFIYLIWCTLRWLINLIFRRNVWSQKSAKWQPRKKSIKSNIFEKWSSMQCAEKIWQKSDRGCDKGTSIVGCVSLLIRRLKPTNQTRFDKTKIKKTNKIMHAHESSTIHY